MKIAFGMFVKNEERFLPCALATAKAFDDSFAIDYGSTDRTLDLLMSSKIKRVYNEQWTGDHGNARMRLVSIARERGNDWLFTLDGDESWTLDFKKLEALTDGTWTSISFPRLNLAAHGFYKRKWWPDIQHRALRLDQNISFIGGPIHAVPAIDSVMVGDRPDNLLAQSVVIEHYGLMKPIAEIDLRFLNYRRIERGELPLDKLPEGHVLGSEFDLSDVQPIL